VGGEEDIFCREAVARDLHWLQDPPAPGEACQVKVRYQAAPANARVVMEGPRLRILFDHPQRAVTPGQAAVVYRGDEVRGGGIIAREGGSD